jgi:hypothetical protein
MHGPTRNARTGSDHALVFEWLTKFDPCPQPGPPEEAFARRCIAANAKRHYLLDRGWVSYSRRTNWYADHDRRHYWPRWVSYRAIIAAVAQLERAGLILHDKKPPGNRHWQSRFLATPKLMELKAPLQYEPRRQIIMRDEDRE